MTDFKIRAVSVTQPIGEFYVASITYRDLIKISSADVRRLKDRDFDEYIGIQRRLNSQRMAEIVQYVQSYDATFPTSVILSIDDDSVYYDSESGFLIISREDSSDLSDIATILDGQHRIEALKSFKGATFDIPVAIFIGADKPTQAAIFATVNLAQTKVNRSLAYDLLSYERKETPAKIAHLVALALDQNPNSPFHKRIKRLGVATEGRNRETLTQSTVVDAIVRFISDNPNRDRNELNLFGFRGKLQKLDFNDYPFREMYKDERDADIAVNLINFFTAVAEKWPNSWASVKEKGNVLPKTNGFRALMRFLRIIYPKLKIKQERDVVTKDLYRNEIDKVHLEDHDFTVDKFPAGTSGESRLFQYLVNSAPEESRPEL